MQRRHSRNAILSSCAIAALFSGGTAEAATYKVGPSQAHKTIAEIVSMLVAGDVVEVDGDATYPGDLTLSKGGSAAMPVTFQGMRKSGKRPVLSGGTNTLHTEADHLLIEGFDITGGSSRCVFFQGGDVTIRDTVIHDCPNHGLLGADEGSGSLTLDYVEVHHAGSGDTHHPIYMATDETAYPGSVFRMQHCYVHDAAGGNSVKTRAERNEIYSNWIEGTVYRAVELIGPDGQDENLAREDSDVVGNVLIKTNSGPLSREGGDGTGETWGRYRFVNNTILLGASTGAAFQLFDGVESIEMHNNALYRVGGGGVTVLDESEVSWLMGEVVAGSDNFALSGSTIPKQWTATVSTGDPGFLAIATDDVEIGSMSAFIDQGNPTTMSPAGHAFPSPLALPTYLPPLHTIEAVGTAKPRVIAGKPDIGAFEYAIAGGGTTSSSASGTGGSSPATTSTSGAGGASSGSGTGGANTGAGAGAGAVTGAGTTAGSGAPSTATTSGGGDNSSVGPGPDQDSGCSAVGGSSNKQTGFGLAMVALAFLASRRRSRR